MVRPAPAVVLALAVALAVALAPGARADDANFCASVTTCLRDGSEACSTATDDCPPCVYTLADSFSCWEKDNSTNTCPFTGVRYDCTGAWSSSASVSSAATAGSSSSGGSAGSEPSASLDASSSSAATAASGSGSSAVSTSELVTYAAIGVAALLVLVVGCVVWRRKRRSARARRDLHTPPHQKRERGKSKRDDALTGPYSNIPETAKAPDAYGGYNASTSTTATATTSSNRTGNYGGQFGGRGAGAGKPRKQSDAIAMMEAGRDSHESFVSIVPTEDAHSFDGFLGERSPSVLGDDARSHRSERSGRGGKGRASRPGVVVGGIGGFAAASDKLAVQQEVASRITTSANMYDEYMRMKQEMELEDSQIHPGRATRDDAMSDAGLSDAGLSDYESDTMSLHKFSLDSSTGMLARHHDNGLSLTDSVTDSEYAAAMRDRGESDCFSEMSYNDEKYSFSESEFDAAASLEGSHARGTKAAAKAAARTAPDREIEI